MICIKQSVFDVGSPSLEYEFYDYDADVAASHYSQQIPLECLIDDDYFKNDAGFYRWNKIRTAYYTRLIDVDRVVDLYRKWRDMKELFVMDGFDVWGDYQISAWGKSAKRGNDVYKFRTAEKFRLLDRLPPLNFDEILDGKTPMLFITLTVDAKKFTLDQAWMQFSDYFHRFLASVQQRYGQFVFLRTWEAHESGYPHCHLVLFFKKRLFVTFNKWSDDKQRFIYRVARKHNDAFRHFWRMGANTDVQAVCDTAAAFSEVKKYVTKSIFTEKADLTNAMISLFNKRQFSLSRDFIEVIWGAVAGKVSSAAIAKRASLASVAHTVHNCNKAYSHVCDFRFAGVCHGHDLPIILDLEPPPLKFFDGKIDYSAADPERELDKEVLSGSSVLGDDVVRFRLGLMSLDHVAGLKLSLLCAWFGRLDDGDF